MTNLFYIEARGEFLRVSERNGKFQVWAGIKGGNAFLVMTKNTLRGAIGYAKRAAA